MISIHMMMQAKLQPKRRPFSQNGSQPELLLNTYCYSYPSFKVNFRAEKKSSQLILSFSVQNDFPQKKTKGINYCCE